MIKNSFALLSRVALALPFTRSLTLAMTLALALAGCSENPVGNECIIQGINDLTPVDDAGVEDFQRRFSAPNLDCSSRTCLYYPTEAGSQGNSLNVPLCSASCESDDDCDKVALSPCESGFTCTIATTVDNFCCQKFCVCSDYLVIPEGGSRSRPGACDPDIEANDCCNLPGRGECTGQ